MFALASMPKELVFVRTYAEQRYRYDVITTWSLNVHFPHVARGPFAEDLGHTRRWHRPRKQSPLAYSVLRKPKSPSSLVKSTRSTLSWMPHMLFSWQEGVMWTIRRWSRVVVMRNRVTSSKGSCGLRCVIFLLKCRMNRQRIAEDAYVHGRRPHLAFASLLASKNLLTYVCSLFCHHCWLSQFKSNCFKSYVTLAPLA